MTGPAPRSKPCLRTDQSPENTGSLDHHAGPWRKPGVEPSPPRPAPPGALPLPGRGAALRCAGPQLSPGAEAGRSCSASSLASLRVSSRAAWRCACCARCERSGAVAKPAESSPGRAPGPHALGGQRVPAAYRQRELAHCTATHREERAVWIDCSLCGVYYALRRGPGGCPTPLGVIRKRSGVDARDRTAPQHGPRTRHHLRGRYRVAAVGEPSRHALLLMPAPDASPESAAAAEAAPEASAAAAAVRGVMQAALPRVLLAVALLVLLAVVGPAPAAANPAASVVTAQLRDPADTYVTAYINVTFRDNRGETRSERSETAKFGDGRIGPARGVLVNAKSLSAPGGCAPPLVRHPSRASNSTALPAEPWIALIPRGHCTFDMKVYTAALSGASAVIVFDDKEADTLDMMDISPEHNITAVLTYHWKGLALAKLADGPSKVYAEITVANRCARSLNSINRTSVLFVSVSFIVLMIISLAWLVFYYVQRFRYIHAKDRLSRRLCSAAKRALSKIPTRRLKIDDPELSGDGDCCAICIERYRVADVVRALPCKHEFHKSCIDPWLLDHRTCPMCKMDILKHYGFVFTGSQESILHLDIEEVAAFGLVDSPHPGRGRLQGQGHGQGLQPAREPQSPSPQLPATPQHDEDPQSATRAHQTQQHADDADMPAKCLGAAETGDLDADLADGDKDARCQPSRPTRATSPGGLSSASVASSGSVSSCCSDGSGGSGNSVTHSILPQAKRPHIVATCHGTCHAACQQPSDLSPPQ